MIKRIRNIILKILVRLFHPRAAPSLALPESIAIDTDFFHYIDVVDLHPEDGIIAVRGWVFSKTGLAVSTVRAQNGSSAFEGAYGFERKDVAAHFRTGPEGLHSGFAIHIPSAELTEQPKLWALEALDENGDWHCFAKTSLAAGNKAP